MKLKSITSLGKESLKNLSSNNTKIFLVTESSGWVVNEISKNLNFALNKKFNTLAKVTKSPLFIKNSIIHFNSFNTFVTKKGVTKIDPSNKIVVTCFHFKPNDPRLEILKNNQQIVDLFHTSCESTKKNLMNLGISEEKIIVIPIAIDLNIFEPTQNQEKIILKKKYNIPENQLIIGSFQKDGQGWDEGLEPKLEKGPDLFIEVINKIKNKKPFVLLTGPARGYVKKNLEKIGVPYKHIYFKNPSNVAEMFKMLDYYFITSRVEGGPKALLEAWATGIPLITTNVGMVPDIATNKDNAMISDVENINTFVENFIEVENNPELKEKLIRNGLESIKNYSWDIISKKYFDQIYSPLLLK